MKIQPRSSEELKATSGQHGQDAQRLRQTSDSHLHVVPEACGATDRSARRPSHALLLRLAEAVARPGTDGREITPTNAAGEFLPLHRAVVAAVAYYVEVAEHILAADFDKTDAEQAASLLAIVLRLRGVPAVRLASGQRGRRHVFAFVPRADWMSELKSFAKQLGADVRSHIRPPLSPHRLQGESEVRVSLLAPNSPQEALRALTTRGLADHISDQMWRKIVSGQGRGYASTSEFVRAAAVAVLNLGWRLEAFMELLTAEGTALAEAYGDRAERRGLDATQEWVRQQIWPGAEKLVRESPAKGRDEAVRLAAMRVWALSRSWPGRRGPGTQAVLLALIDKASLTGRFEFNASLRELADLSGISGLQTVRRGLAALQDAGVLRDGDPRELDRDESCPAYRRSSPRRLVWLQEMETFLDQAATDIATEEALAHDVWRNRVGLGKSAQRLYRALTTTPGTPAELAGLLGVTVRTVRRQLKSLQLNGLAACRSDGSWRHVEMDLDVLASEIGAQGRGERQRQKHAQQRAGYDHVMENGIRAIIPGFHDQIGQPDDVVPISLEP